ncbi:insulinase family protein [Synechococcus sp. A10-1-5-1]|uniref:M16 family metallopeptidase n=1 Tax=Synechococcus sp. A10-1-5-1 TaxID=2936507 RepID=UPI0020013D66|nr:pitrilysin family protein [Synechococcus sp. A10-1-5-1]UPM50461.1 insulinase family protein [Synechococcus sp. A10-1-5-1]
MSTGGTQQLSLSGGCPLWLIERPGPAILSAKLWIRGGSSADPVGQRGVSQLLAGVLSRGCGRLSGDALADLVEGRGAGLRCEAAEDGTLISLKCASDDAALLLPLILQMVTAPWLVEDQITLERQLNLQTLQRQKEDPFQVAHDQLRQQLYGSGPYGHDPLGVEAELAQLGRPQLEQMTRQLGLEGAVLVLAGQIPSQPEQLLLQELDGQAWSTQSPVRKAGASGLKRGSLASNLDDTEQLVLMLGTTTGPLGSDQALALRLLHCHLGIGMSSRLFVALREENGLAYDVGVHYPARLGDAPFVFHLSSSSDRAKEATQELLNEWWRLLQEPISEEQLNLAKAKFRGQEALGRQTCSQIADRHALVLGHGLPFDFADRCLIEAEELSPTDLHQAAVDLLQNPCLSLCGPKEALASAAAVWNQHPLNRS